MLSCRLHNMRPRATYCVIMFPYEHNLAMINKKNTAAYQKLFISETDAKRKIYRFNNENI